MRILFLSPYANQTTGVGRFVQSLSERLRSRRHEAVVVEPSAAEVPTGFGNSVLAWRSLRAIWQRRARSDVVHCQQLHLQSLVAGLFARGLGKGVVLTVHGRSPRPRGLRGLAFDLVERVCLRVPHRVIFVSESLRRVFGRGRVIPPGVPVADIRVQAASRQELRRELGLNGAFVLLFLGRVTVDKGFLTLLDALVSARNKIAVPLRLLAVGPVAEDVARDVSMRLESLEGSVALVGEREHPWRYLAAADAFVLPSFREGLPLSLLEAMAAGLPSIATSVGDIPDVVHQGSTGWLVLPGDVRGLAAAIVSAATHPDARETMRMQGAALVSERYDLDHTVAAYAEAYAQTARSTETLLAAPPSDAPRKHRSEVRR